MHRSRSPLPTLALSLMLVGLAVQLAAGALSPADVPTPPPAEHVEGDGHSDHPAPSPAAPAVTLGEAQHAGLGGGLFDRLATFFGELAVILRGSYICDDCNLPSDDGCQCVCWSGNPRPGDCD